MARVRSAKQWQHPKAPIRMIAMRSKRMVRQQLREALSHLDDVFDKKLAIELIRHGQHRAVVKVIDWNHFREILKAPFDRIAEVYFAGAKLGVKKINGAFARSRRRVRFAKVANRSEAVAALFDAAPHLWKAVGDRFNFDRFDDKVMENLRAEQDALIREIEATARDTIEKTIMRGMNAGLTPDEVIEEVRTVIGLTDRQATAVLNYRDMIENLDRGALKRMLRDDQYDAALARSIEEGIELDAAAVSEMVDAYAENYLTYRAETIARTETTRAANSGLEDAYAQAIDRGALPEEAVRKFWQIALDEKTCAICLSIPDLNPDGVPIGEDFDSEDGPQSTPPDPHPSCRCSIDVITDLNLIPDEEN